MFSYMWEFLFFFLILPHISATLSLVSAGFWNYISFYHTIWLPMNCIDFSFHNLELSVDQIVKKPCSTVKARSPSGCQWTIINK